MKLKPMVVTLLILILQSTEIEATGKLVHISTDYAIPVDCDRVLDDYDKAWCQFPNRNAKWSKRDG